MLFSYKAYDKNGSPRKGIVEADSEKNASEKLLAEGLYVRHIVEASHHNKVSGVLRANFYRELSALLAAGLDFEKALDILRSEMPEASVLIAGASQALRGGHGLSDALASAGAPQSESAAVAAAEYTGTLAKMLASLAAKLDAAEDTRAKIKAALVYPCFVVVLGVLVATVMLGVILPRASATLAASGMTLPRTSGLLIILAKAFVFTLIPLCFIIASVLYGAKIKARKNIHFAIAFDKFLFQLPFSEFFRIDAIERFSSVLETLLSGGMPLPDAIPLAGASTGRPSVAESAQRAAAMLRSGSSPAKAINEMGFVGESLAQWFRIGDAAGCLPRMLYEAAHRLDAQRLRILSSHLSLLGPVLLAIVGLFVLIISLALILPILSLTQNGIG